MKQKLGFLNTPCRATAQHFYEQILPILPIRFVSNIVTSADIYQHANALTELYW